MTEPSFCRIRRPGRRFRTQIGVVSAAIGIAGLLAGCGGAAHPAGPPKAAALAAKLGCRVESADSDPMWGYDTTQYIDATGGPCSNGTITDVYAVIITFPSQTKENDWLHQNSIAESSSFPDGYAEAVVGHLWAVTNGGAFPTGYVIRKLGGRDTTF